MKVHEDTEHDRSPLSVGLEGLEIPADWLKQSKGTTKKTDGVDLAYLTQLATEIESPSPMTYAAWHQALLSIYSRINNVEHKGAQALWIAFLRKGITSLHHLITQTTEEIIKKEVAKLIEAKSPRIIEMPTEYHAEVYWTEASEANQWYMSLEYLLSGHAGLTQQQTILIGEEMIELVCKPFERISISFCGKTPSPNKLMVKIVRYIENAKAPDDHSEFDHALMMPVRARLKGIMTQLCTEN